MLNRSAGGAPGRPLRPRPPPRGPMPRGAAGVFATTGAFAAAVFTSCADTDSASAARAISKSSPRRRRSITSPSCASLRMRGKLRSLRLSLSRPSSSRAFARRSPARTDSSPVVSAATERRTRSYASSRVRRSPLAPICSAESARSARGVTSGRGGRGARPRGRAGSAGVAVSIESGMPSGAVADTAASSLAAGASAPATRGRSSRSRPRPRRPRRLRPPSRLASAAATGSVPRADSSAAAVSASRASPMAPLGRPISSCPFSSLVAESRPRCTASCTKRENFAMPRSFSSNELSISCITCLRRSERMTSPLRCMRLTASVTSSHGSHFFAGSSSRFFTRPARAL